MANPVILIADDEPEMFDLIVEYLVDELSGLSFVPYQATTGGECIDLLTKHKPDVMLIDFYMPEPHGIDLLEKIRKVNPAVPVIIMSALPPKEIKQDLLRFENIKTILKPFSPADIGKMVRGMLRLA